MRSRCEPSGAAGGGAGARVHVRLFVAILGLLVAAVLVLFVSGGGGEAESPAILREPERTPPGGAAGAPTSHPPVAAQAPVAGGPVGATGAVASDAPRGGVRAPAPAAAAGRPPTAGAPETPSARPPAPTASDRGVSPTAIRLGIPLIDLGNLGRIGDFGPTNPEGQRRVWQAFVDEINDTGGINGRKVEPFYRAYDSLSASDQRTACLWFAEDAKVFAIVGGFNLEQPHYCLTVEHGIPTMTLGTVGVSDDAFERSHGRLASMLMRGGRVMSNFADQLHREGLLRNKTIGITGDELSDPKGRTAAQLKAALRALGYTVAREGRYSPDYGTAASQVPVEVNQMQARGVDAILLISHSLANMQFVQQAEGQGYRPAYFTTDWAAQTLDATTNSMPRSFEGAIGVTSLRFNDRVSNLPDPVEARRCIERYERRTGSEVPRQDQQGRDHSDYGGVITPCVMATLFRDAAISAGPVLTREGYSRALQGLGPAPILSARIVGPASFGPGKLDAPDSVRLMRWRFACKCWEAVTDFRRTAV